MNLEHLLPEQELSTRQREAIEAKLNAAMRSSGVRPWTRGALTAAAAVLLLGGIGAASMLASGHRLPAVDGAGPLPRSAHPVPQTAHPHRPRLSTPPAVSRTSPALSQRPSPAPAPAESTRATPLAPPIPHPALSPCTAADLRVIGTVTRSPDSTTVETVYSVRNDSTHPCSASGYLPAEIDGASIPHTASDPGVTPGALGPGEVAEFTLRTAAGPACVEPTHSAVVTLGSHTIGHISVCGPASITPVGIAKTTSTAPTP